MERKPKLSFYFIIWTVFNSIRGKYIPPERPHSWHWKVFATLFVRHLESLGLLWNTTLQPKHAFSLVETWVSWHHRCPNLSGYSGLSTWQDCWQPRYFSTRAKEEASEMGAKQAGVGTGTEAWDGKVSEPNRQVYFAGCRSQVEI